VVEYAMGRGGRSVPPGRHGMSPLGNADILDTKSDLGESVNGAKPVSPIPKKHVFFVRKP